MATFAAPMAEMADTADLGSTIDEAFSESTADEGQSEQQQAPPESAPPAQEPAPPVQDPAQPPVQDAKTVDGYAVDAAGNYIVPKHELPQLQSARQYADAVQQQFPTPADANAAYLRSSDFDMLMNDLQYGSETETDAILNFFAGNNAADPQIQASMRAGFERLASRVPAMLAKINPQAHATHVDGLVQSRVDALYQKAQETGAPDDFLRAQRFEWGVTGRYKTELAKVDPAKVAQDQLAQQRQEFEVQQGQALERDWTSYNKSNVDGPRWAQFNTEIDAALKTIKDAYAPAVYNALRSDISKQLLEKLQVDFEFVRTQNIARTQIQKGYEQAWKTRQPASSLSPRIQAYTQNFMARARQLLPSIAKTLINDAAAKPAAAQKQAAPQASPQQQPTSRAANGQFQPKHTLKLSEDPEFAGMFQ